jgi:Fe-S-cluster-containing dehydrogenase component
MHYGMAIDLNRCIGCQSCTAACKMKNGVPAGVFLSKVLVTESGQYPNTRVDYQPMLCMHCNNPSCLQVCPTGATSKRADGIVVVNQDECIGCEYCVNACPYDARTFLQAMQPYYQAYGPTPYEKASYAKLQTGVVTKCDFCKDRVDKAQLPACVATCPTQARTFGDLDDPNSEISKLLARRRGTQMLAELGNDPSVFYLA